MYAFIWTGVIGDMLQGIPLGLSMGSVPFLLKKKLGYAELATFSLASYPYSLKVFILLDSTFIIVVVLVSYCGFCLLEKVWKA